MSDTVPVLYKGDKVRIMQTDEMVKRAYANLQGYVFGNSPEVDDYENVLVCLRDGRVVLVPCSCLMRIDRYTP